MLSKNRIKFHHIGIVARDMNETLKFLRENFVILSVSDVVYDQKQDATLQLVKTKDLAIELISGRIVENLIKKSITYYHLCYSVKNIDEAINELKDAMVISPPKEAKLFDNKRVAFLMTPLGLIELLEEK